MTGRFPLPFSGPSSASKAAIEAFADVYRTELKLFGVDFIIVQAGAMLTRIQEPFFKTEFGKTGNITAAVGPSGLPILIDTFVRLTKSPVVSIAKIRGCVRGVSSEFVLACDMRLASRENTLLGQPEVGVGV
jgi:NAD(P)-dependent dehydrogenase (short-subunit alcohol dehydrogenase family)